MRFLHTSDWHLGMTYRGGISYADDQRYAIDGICAAAEDEGVDGILIAGDIFDKSVSSQEALMMCDGIITHICSDLKIPVYMIAGNHDGAQRLAQYNRLLRGSGLYIAGSLTKDVCAINAGDADIYLLPWISTDKVKTVYPERAEEIGSMESAYRIVLDEYRKHFMPGRFNILLAHAFIVEAETCVSDRAAEVGRATAVGSQVFDGFDYVALGHLHAPQDITDTIRYSGSPMAYAFGKEEKQVKSVTIVDTSDGSHRIVPIPQLRARTTLTGTLDSLMKADFDESVVNGYVRLEVTDSYVGIETMASLRERYANLLEVVGKDLERADATITMTIDELSGAAGDPGTVFAQYCADTLSTEPDDHLIRLFEDSVMKYNGRMSTV